MTMQKPWSEADYLLLVREHQARTKPEAIASKLGRGVGPVRGMVGVLRRAGVPLIHHHKKAGASRPRKLQGELLIRLVEAAKKA